MKPTKRSPKRMVIDRALGLELDRMLESIKTCGEWYLIGEFAESPLQARNYHTRMKRLHGERFRFSSSIESDGIGRLYARRISLDDAK